MTDLATPPATAGTDRADEDVPLPLRPGRTRADVVFRVLLMAASVIVLLAIGAIVAYLAHSGWPALKTGGSSTFLSDKWAPLAAQPTFGVLGVLQGTVLIAVLALGLALPIGVGLGLMINEYAPIRMRRSLTSVVDLLAALPSLIYGLWGLLLLSPEIYPLTKWLSVHASFIPLFQVPNGTFGESIFICSIVVAIMILPIVTSVSREVMSQALRDACEAALALGGTRWGMITDVILPFSKSGILGGALLGLGRALGETVAVLLILSQTNVVNWHILEPGGGQIPAMIANNFTSVDDLTKSALTLFGLVLFVTILCVNWVARAVVKRSGPVVV